MTVVPLRERERPCADVTHCNRRQITLIVSYFSNPHWISVIERGPLDRRQKPVLGAGQEPTGVGQGGRGGSSATSAGCPLTARPAPYMLPAGSTVRRVNEQLIEINTLMARHVDRRRDLLSTWRWVPYGRRPDDFDYVEFPLSWEHARTLAQTLSS